MSLFPFNQSSSYSFFDEKSGLLHYDNKNRLVIKNLVFEQMEKGAKGKTMKVEFSILNEKKKEVTKVSSNKKKINTEEGAVYNSTYVMELKDNVIKKEEKGNKNELKSSFGNSSSPEFDLDHQKLVLKIEVVTTQQKFIIVKNDKVFEEEIPLHHDCLLHTFVKRIPKFGKVSFDYLMTSKIARLNTWKRLFYSDSRSLFSIAKPITNELLSNQEKMSKYNDKPMIRIFSFLGIKEKFTLWFVSKALNSFMIENTDKIFANDHSKNMKEIELILSNLSKKKILLTNSFPINSFINISHDLQTEKTQFLSLYGNSFNVSLVEESLEIQKFRSYDRLQKVISEFLKVISLKFPKFMIFFNNENKKTEFASEIISMISFEPSIILNSSKIGNKEKSDDQGNKLEHHYIISNFKINLLVFYYFIKNYGKALPKKEYLDIFSVSSSDVDASQIFIDLFSSVFEIKDKLTFTNEKEIEDFVEIVIFLWSFFSSQNSSLHSLLRNEIPHPSPTEDMPWTEKIIKKYFGILKFFVKFKGSMQIRNGTKIKFKVIDWFQKSYENGYSLTSCYCLELFNELINSSKAEIDVNRKLLKFIVSNELNSKEYFVFCSRLFNSLTTVTTTSVSGLPVPGLSNNNGNGNDKRDENKFKLLVYQSFKYLLQHFDGVIDSINDKICVLNNLFPYLIDNSTKDQNFQELRYVMIEVLEKLNLQGVNTESIFFESFKIHIFNFHESVTWDKTLQNRISVILSSLSKFVSTSLFLAKAASDAQKIKKIEVFLAGFKKTTDKRFKDLKKKNEIELGKLKTQFERFKKSTEEYVSTEIETLKLDVTAIFDQKFGDFVKHQNKNFEKAFDVHKKDLKNLMTEKIKSAEKSITKKNEKKFSSYSKNYDALKKEIKKNAVASERCLEAMKQAKSSKKAKGKKKEKK